MALHRTWFSFACATVVAAVLSLVDCSSGGVNGTIPTGSMTQGATMSQADAAAFMRSITPKSVLPNSVAVPEMQGLAGTRAALSLRTTQSVVNTVSFAQLQGAATYVAASPTDGTFWVLGTQGLPNGDKYIYHCQSTGGCTNVPGAASRIAVGPDNTPWVVNSAGGIYHLVNGTFTGIAGGASELSVGGTASATFVDVISNQSPGPYGAGIYQYNVSTSTWTQLPGAGTTIAVSIDPVTYSVLNIKPGGFYVTNAAGSIFYYNLGAGFEQLPGGAIRLAPTATGGLFALGDPTNPMQHGIYYNDLSTGKWTQMPGAAVSISASSQGLYAIGAAGGIYAAPLPSPTSGIYYDFTGYSIYVPSGVTSLQTTLTAPLFASSHLGQVAIWPGLEPNAGNYVLQPTILYTNESTYKNTTGVFGADNLECCIAGTPGLTTVGSGITVNPGDKVQMSMSVSGSVWTIAETDTTTGQVAGNAQFDASTSAGVSPMTFLTFIIESHWNDALGIPFDNFLPDVVFSNTSFTSSQPMTSCALSPYSPNTTQPDTVTGTTMSNGGTTCSYSAMTIYPETAPGTFTEFLSSASRRSSAGALKARVSPL